MGKHKENLDQFNIASTLRELVGKLLDGDLSPGCNIERGKPKEFYNSLPSANQTAPIDPLKPETPPHNCREYDIEEIIEEILGITSSESNQETELSVPRIVFEMEQREEDDGSGCCTIL